MNIAENILKHSLQNVYFLAGSAMAGKTTMSKALAKKHGFIHFNDNWHEDSFKVWQSILDERYQKKATKRSSVTDWEAYFGRTVEEFLADDDFHGNNEYLEFAIIELIKLSQKSKVIADITIPIPLLVELSDYSRIACMSVLPELATTRAYGSREDHREFLECILSLKNPEEKLAVQDELFRIGIEKTLEEARRFTLFTIVRDGDSTVERTLGMLEGHFGL
ncbi:MAG: hypothetical protein FWC73_11535 [Defluviitaleaceae bacterium]|nr:hypothetical protein [Defluviitaleaceae bacterium]